MPSPIGHALLGCSIVLGWLPLGQVRRHLLPVFFILLLAVLPDLDLVVGSFFGDMNALHRQASHSVFVAVVASVLCWGLLSLVRGRVEGLFLILFLLASGSHLLADWLGDDGAEPFGLMLGWPFSEAYFISPVSIFPQLKKASVADMFGAHNFAPMVQEVLIVAGVLFLVWGVRVCWKRGKTSNR